MRRERGLINAPSRLIVVFFLTLLAAVTFVHAFTRVSSGSGIAATGRANAAGTAGTFAVCIYRLGIYVAVYGLGSCEASAYDRACDQKHRRDSDIFHMVFHITTGL